MGQQYYVCSASSHTKLVRWENNSKKETLMYIPHVSCNCRLRMYNHVISGWEVHEAFTKLVFGLYLCDCAFLVYLMSSASNHMKLVRRGDNLKKKLSCICHMSHAIKGSPERLPANWKKIWSGGVTHQQIGCVYAEWEKSQQRSSDPDHRMEKIPAAELGLRVREIPLADSGSQLLPSGKNPSSRVVTSVRTWSGGITYRQMGCVYSEWEKF